MSIFQGASYSSLRFFDLENDQTGSHGKTEKNNRRKSLTQTNPGESPVGVFFLGGIQNL